MEPEETTKLANDIDDFMKELLTAEQFEMLSEYSADLADVYEIATHTRQAIEQLLQADSTDEQIEALDVLDRELLMHLPNHLVSIGRFTDRLSEYLEQQIAPSSANSECEPVEAHESGA